MTINSPEQYTALSRLCRLTKRLGLKETSNILLSILEDNKDEWEPCNDCSELPGDCVCEEYESYDQYDDGASYE